MTADDRRRRRRHSSGRRRNSRGAAAIEAALTLPLVIIVMLGVIEVAFLMKDDVALTSLVRNGGRIASANADKGAGGTSEGGDCISPCSPANAPMLAQLAANAIQQSGTALPGDSILKLWVYKANAQGYPGTATSFSACNIDCVEYKWQPTAGKFRYLTGSWTSSTINACANNPPDSVGIYMVARHKFLTSFFGATADIEDHAVFQFEPLASLSCSPGTHP